MTNLDMIEKIDECMSLQDTFNKKVNLQWQKAGYPFSRAAWMEMAEAMGPTDWKWWKKQTDDRYQTTLEMVDIFHFMLSDSIIKGHTASVVMSNWVSTKSRFPAQRANDIQYALTSAEQFISNAAGDGKMFWSDFFGVMLALDIKLETVLSLYITKNCLNNFRQDNGYKKGEYIKEWFGKEDNKVLEEITSSNTNISYADLYAALSSEYALVLAETQKK